MSRYDTPTRIYTNDTKDYLREKEISLTETTKDPISLIQALRKMGTHQIAVFAGGTEFEETTYICRIKNNKVIVGVIFNELEKAKNYLIKELKKEKSDDITYDVLRCIIATEDARSHLRHQLEAEQTKDLEATVEMILTNSEL